jgi:hypothetical protein
MTRLGADFLPEVRRGSVRSTWPCPRLVAEGVERGVSLIDARLQTMQKSKDNRRPDPELRPPHRPGRTGRARQPVNVGEYILTMNPRAYRRDEFLKSVLRNCGPRCRASRSRPSNRCRT